MCLLFKCIGWKEFYYFICHKSYFKKQNARVHSKAREGSITFHKDLSKASNLISIVHISSICTLHEDDLSYLT